MGALPVAGTPSDLDARVTKGNIPRQPTLYRQTHAWDLFADDTPMPGLDAGRERTKMARSWLYTQPDRSCAGSDSVSRSLLQRG